MVLSSILELIEKNDPFNFIGGNEHYKENKKMILIPLWSDLDTKMTWLLDFDFHIRLVVFKICWNNLWFLYNYFFYRWFGYESDLFTKFWLL